ncbi:MAG TPA: hypothetical protein VFO46_05160 [Candidatus Sulfotelmatobacter sp.]|nr:hypothetical protein [Candidatus Sulfotelmatobacter sp.]
MTPINKFDNTGRTPLDDQLDAALAKYAAVEPRTGLEERILANLKSQPSSSTRVAWWRWAAVVAAALIVTSLVLWVEKHNARPIVRRSTTSSEQASHPTIAQSAPPNSTRRVNPVKVRRAGKRSFTQPLTTAEMKLDRFPSPRPLSEEELALVRYVQSFPREATLIAQAQEEFELQMQKEMNAAGSQNQPSGSVQSER